MRLLRHISLRVVAAVLMLLAIAGGATVLVLRSGWFHEYVRARVIEELQRATGGRAEIGQFEFDWEGLNAHVARVVLHGKEAADEAPLIAIDSANVGLRVLSVVERRVDLGSLEVANPRVHVIVYPDGSTNFPGVAGNRGTTWVEELLNLKVRRYSITGGELDIDSRKLPLTAQGEDLTVRLVYDPRGPAYDGTVTAGKVRFIAPQSGPVEGSVDATVRLEKSRIWFPRMRLSSQNSGAQLQGTIEDLRAPRGSFDVQAAITIADAAKYVNVLVSPQGSARYNGTLTFNFAPRTGSVPDWELNGRVAASGLAYMRDRLKIQNAAVTAALRASPDGAVLRGIVTQVLGAKITGNAQLPGWKRFTMDGQVEALNLRGAASVLTSTPVAWNGTLAGDFHADAPFEGGSARVEASLAIAPASEGVPIEGQMQARYDQALNTVALGSSWVATPMTRADVSGTLGQTLAVKLRTTNLDDLLPAIAMVEANPPKELPLKLVNGVVTAEGTVTGPLDNPRFSGPVSVTNGIVEGHTFDMFAGQIETSRTELRGSRITLNRGGTTLAGTASITAANGAFEQGAIAAAVTIQNQSVEALLKEVGSTLEASGTAAATVRVSGTLDQPQAEVTADVAQPAAFGEHFSRLQTTARYSKDLLEVVTGDLFDGPSSIRFSGSFKAEGADWRSGALAFDAATQTLGIRRFEHVVALKPEMDATVTGRARGTARVSASAFTLESITSDLAIDKIRVAEQDLGSLALALETREGLMQVRATGKLRESAVDARGAWQLSGDNPGSLTARFSRLSVETLHELLMTGGTEEERQSPVPFEGFVEGGVTVNVALRRPADFRAEVTIDTLQLTPKATQVARLGVQPQDIVLKNSRPVIADVTAREARLRQAVFTGRDTSIEASGAIPLVDGANADLAVRGNLNLILLQLLNPDLTARGDAVVQASIRGNVRDPVVNGRLELKGASLYFSDLPNGLDNANGVVLFDRNRATIEKLSAETGGGKLALTGVMEFGNAVVYRLQADAQQVRIRYPEDLSTTFNAKLGLSGTSESSTLSGVVTLNRTAFNPRTDLGQLLAQTAKPLPAPSAPNELLRGVQFDVRIESGPNFTVETTLTRDVEAEVDLHVRGSPLRPVVLGNISVNQGEVQVFGNRYTIDRGDIRFLNPVKIEPSFDMDLETRARGVTVNVSFSGTMQRLKVNYSSDPPLQSAEIIALLAVGRDPTSNQVGSQAVPGSAGSSSFVEAGSGLLGQAVSAQLSSRLQRFFGASRVKIDPTLTGVDNLPQARLTLEQQVSKDITLTYITNLNRTQEQIVRLQWDLNRNWSAVAVRDQNGLFGIDVQYRKRF